MKTDATAGDSALAAPTDSATKGTTVIALNIDAIAIAIGFAFSAGAMAESIPKEYQSGEEGFAPTPTESPMRELG